MNIKLLMTSMSLFVIMMAPAFAKDAAHQKTQTKQVSQKKKQPFVSDSYVLPPSVIRTVSTPDIASVPRGEMVGTDMDRLIQTYLTNVPIDWDNPGRSFVSVGPYVNIPVQFSGDNLIINDPKINTDVALLKLRKAAHQGLAARGVHTEEDTHHSHLILSGNLSGVGQYIEYGKQNGTGAAGNNGSSSNFNLSNAEIDVFLLSPSPWISAFMAINYDDSLDATLSNSKSQNSRLYLNNALIIVGDFLRSPFYATLGQMYVPFGTYSSVFISSPLTKRFARTKARAFLGGFQQQSDNAFYTAVYAFQGDSHGSATSRINNGGVNVGYRFAIPSPDISGDIGASWIGNIADSAGMQNTGNQPSFNGFGGPSPYGIEKIVHRVPALNVRGKFSIGRLDLIEEYVGVTTSFNPNDLSFGVDGAKPWALNSEAAYTFTVLDKPTSIGIGYGQVKEALALGLPARRYGVVLNTSIWHNTVQSIECRHDINYSASQKATGSNVSPTISGRGLSDDVITLEFDVYF